MNLDFIHEIVYIITALISYYLWKRYHDKDCLRLTWIGAIAAVVYSIDYAITNIFQSPIELRLINDLVFIVFWPMVLFLILRIAFKSSKKGKNK